MRNERPLTGSLARSAGAVGAATLLSRLLGFLRDVLIAMRFGATPQADAFFVAFRLPNLLRRLTAEGAFTAGFVPVFAECVGRSQEARRLLRSALGWWSALLAGVAILGVTLSPQVVLLVAPGFRADPERLGMAVVLNRIVFPYVFLVSLLALAAGVLNTLGHFALPALAPAALNVCMITALLWASPRLGIEGLAWGVIAGGMVQLTMQLPPLVSRRMLVWPSLHPHPALRRMGALIAPAALGAAAYQINVLVGTMLASLLPRGSISYLYYARRLLEFPLGVVAVAVATVVLPLLSSHRTAGDPEGFRETLTEGMRLVTFLCIPAACGLALLAEPIISALFQRGSFGSLEAVHTARALWLFAPGLWAIAGVRVVSAAFYSLQQPRIPLMAGMVSVALDLALSVLLAFGLGMGYRGIALATSLSSFAHFGLLLHRLRARAGAVNWGEMNVCLVKTCLATGGMALALRASAGHGLILRIILGGTLFLLVSRLLGSQELGLTARLLRR